MWVLQRSGLGLNLVEKPLINEDLIIKQGAGTTGLIEKVEVGGTVGGCWGVY